MKTFYILGIVLLLFSCTGKDNLEIGFIGDFTSGQSDMATQCRNAVDMAIDEINSNGGLLGRQVSIVAGDNGNRAESYRKIISDFQARGIRYIIAACTSEMAIPLLDEVKGKDMLVISPVVSSDDFGGIDDNFFRIQANASIEGEDAGNAIIRRGDKAVVLVRSLNNDIYTNAYMSGVRKALKKESIPVVGDLTFSDRNDFISLIDHMVSLKPDAIVFSALGVDAGAIIQQYAKVKPLPHLYADLWAKTTGVAKYGGKYCEEMVSGGLINSNSDKNLESQFKENYKKRYSVDPVFYDIYAYEAVLMLKEGIEKSRKILTAVQMKDFLIRMNDFDGVLGHLEFDRFGDSQRTTGLYIIKNGVYVPF